MKLLLDTHSLAWWWREDSRLPRLAHAAIANADEVFVSAVSVFELATKHRLGKWPEAAVVLASLSRLMKDDEFEALPISHHHGHVAGALPQGHRDPFDRILAAQAQTERLTLVTGDPAFALFGVSRIWSEIRQ